MNSLILRLGLVLAFSSPIFGAEEKPAKIAESPSAEVSKAKAALAKQGESAEATAPDPVEAEFRRIMEMDDAAQEECDRWIKEFNAFEAQAPGTGGSKAALSLKVEARLNIVRKAYEEFLQRNPKHVEARIAYGSFLNDIQEENEAAEQWEKARELEPTNPAPYNNLANHYGHFGPIKKAFEFYEKAIELNPREPVYLRNFATTTYLFRKDAMERYGISEAEVFNKALDLYRQALKLDPKNFLLATDLAESYYGIRPLRTQEALDAWNYALKVAETDLARQGVYLHLARVELNSGMFDEARRHLDMVTLEGLQGVKTRLERNLTEKKNLATKNSSDKKSDTTRAEDKPSRPVIDSGKTPGPEKP